MASWLERAGLWYAGRCAGLAGGLLTFVAYRGMVISELDHQSVMGLYSMREHLRMAQGARLRLIFKDAEAGD